MQRNQTFLCSGVAVLASERKYMQLIRDLCWWFVTKPRIQVNINLDLFAKKKLLFRFSHVNDLFTFLITKGYALNVSWCERYQHIVYSRAPIACLVSRRSRFSSSAKCGSLHFTSTSPNWCLIHISSPRKHVDEQYARLLYSNITEPTKLSLKKDDASTHLIQQCKSKTLLTVLATLLTIMAKGWKVLLSVVPMYRRSLPGEILCHRCTPSL